MEQGYYMGISDLEYWYFHNQQIFKTCIRVAIVVVNRGFFEYIE